MTIAQCAPVIRANDHPTLRCRAPFRLAGMDDPRVLSILEEILTAD